MAGKKKKQWYSISFIGGLMMALYAFIPPFVVYADTLGILPFESRVAAVGGMSFVLLIVFAARRRGHKLFSRRQHHKGLGIEQGFTLMEILVVISIIGIMSAIVLPVFSNAREAAYFTRAKAEFKSIATAIELYTNATGSSYPGDVNRGLPPGLEVYLAPGEWPQAPWQESVYDWDAWAPGDLSHPPQTQVYQISVRFCPLGEPTQCNFPNEEWAEGFDYYSAVYYCFDGPCRSHSSQPIDHPGYCINC